MVPFKFCCLPSTHVKQKPYPLTGIKKPVPPPLTLSRNQAQLQHSCHSRFHVKVTSSYSHSHCIFYSRKIWHWFWPFLETWWRTPHGDSTILDTKEMSILQSVFKVSNRKYSSIALLWRGSSYLHQFKTLSIFFIFGMVMCFIVSYQQELIADRTYERHALSQFCNMEYLIISFIDPLLDIFRTW